MKLLLSILLAGLVQILAAQPSIGLRTVGFEDLDSLMRSDERPVAVFLHADWCRYCAHMLATTFRDQGVVDRLDQSYYFVAFNGESREPVNWRGRQYVFRPRGRNTGVHTLAEALGSMDDGTFSYPTFILLSPEYEVLFRYPAFLSADQMRRILDAGRRPPSG